MRADPTDEEVPNGQVMPPGNQRPAALGLKPGVSSSLEAVVATQEQVGDPQGLLLLCQDTPGTWIEVGKRVMCPGAASLALQRPLLRQP